MADISLMYLLPIEHFVAAHMRIVDPLHALSGALFLSYSSQCDVDLFEGLCLRVWGIVKASTQLSTGLI